MSLRTRLLIFGTVFLVLFLGAAGLVLDRAFQQAARQAVQNRLQAHLYALVAISEVDEQQQLQMVGILAEPRLTMPNSGLYAQVSNEEGLLLWSSPSVVSQLFESYQPAQAGEMIFGESADTDETPLFILSMKLTWELPGAGDATFIYTIAEDWANYSKQLNRFRASMWLGFVVASALLLLLLWWGLYLGLRSLQKVAEQVQAIEKGQREKLTGNYPLELESLTKNLNAFIENEKRQRERVRNSLGDLAHSLKTPLAVMQTTMENEPDENRRQQIVSEQLSRIREIIESQLQRAATSGRATLGQSIQVRPLIEKLDRGLQKVYFDKQVQSSVVCDDEVVFHGDAGDLMEVAGNLMDNAYKWCETTVSIALENINDANYRRSGLRLVVEDDGGGIDEISKQEVLKRGVRADARVSGHGLGLNMVKNVMDAYGGELYIQDGDGKGARIVVEFPPT